MDARRYDSVNNHLIRAQEIVNELRASLNMKAGDVAENLDRLYEYIQHRLMMANIRKEKSFVNECIRMMSDLRNTWKELFDKTSPEEIPQAGMNLGQRDGSSLNLQG
jgi:flagellar protein FliS